MKGLARVVWSEGMHLSQHHFQAQNAWFEDITRATVSSLFQAPYGLIEIQLDQEALLNGTAAILSARGIMPDGMHFSFPDESAPEPLQLRELFSPTQASHLLLLAIPGEQPGRANTAMDNGSRGALRFSAEERRVADETTGTDERPVRLARKNFRLLLDVEADESLVTLPIARVQRDGAGHFIYDPGYIGPALRIAAHRQLIELASRLVDVLESRADSVRSERAAGSGASAEYAQREIAGFWLLHALNSAIPQLRHAIRSGGVHPEQLFLQLSQLGGALCTFSLRSHPRELPTYSHDAPEDCFRALERHIRAHLEVLLPSSAVSLPVRETAPGFYAATVEDARCFDPGAHWFLGLRSSISSGDLMSRGPKLVKACSAKIITWLAQKAHAGLTLEHVPRPPAELSPRIGTQYFAIRRTDPCWSSLVETREIGLYVPAAIADPEIEVKVVLGG